MLVNGVVGKTYTRVPYENVLCERLIGEAGSAKLIDEPDYNKAVEKLIAAYNAGETDCYIKTDIEFQDIHEISANPQEIDVHDEQRQHKTRKLTIILKIIFVDCPFLL